MHEMRTARRRDSSCPCATSVPATARVTVASGEVRAVSDPEGLVTPGIEALALAGARTCDRDTQVTVRAACGHLWGVRLSPGDCGGVCADVEVDTSCSCHGLTPRQLEVLSLLALGASNNEIARRLGVTSRTAGSHVESVFTRLGVTSRSLAAATALDEGLMLLDAVPTGPDAPDLAVVRLSREWKAVLAARAASPAGGGTRLRGKGPRLAASHPLDSRTRRHPFRIASIVPSRMTGERLDMVQGAQLAGRVPNRHGGIRGAPVEHVVVDCDVFSHVSLADAVERALGQDVDALLVGYNLDYPHTEQVLRHLGAARVPVLHASTSVLAIENVADNPATLGNIFHICGGDLLYGRGVEAFLDRLARTGSTDLTGRRLAVVGPPPGMSVMDPTVLDRLSGRGMQVTVVPRHQALCSSHERSRIVRAVTDADPDVLVCASFLDTDLLLDLLAAPADPSCPPFVISFFTPSLAGFARDHEELLEKVVWATQTGTYGDVLGSRFSQEFAGAFGREPGYSQAGVHYDAVSLLVRAWNEAEHPRDVQEVLSIMRQSVHRGVNGSYWLGRPGQSSLTFPFDTLDASLAQAQLFYQVRHGRSVVVHPEAYACEPVRLDGTRMAS